MSDITPDIVNLDIPEQHIDIRLVRAPETYLFGSRGSFKTTVAIPLYILDCVADMPRHTGVIVVPSYEHFEINTKPPLIKGFRDLGFYSGEHYVIGELPPDSWPKAYDFDPKIKPKQLWTWYNGTQYIVVSLARVGAGNAISAQSGVFDEVKLMQEAKLEQLWPIFRGNEKYFENRSMFLSKFLCTDKDADPAEIAWLLAKREQVDHDKVNDVRTIQMEVNHLYSKLPECNSRKEKMLRKEIAEKEVLLKRARKGMVFVKEINCFDVKPYLGETWFANARSLVKNEHTWLVAYENEDPVMPGESFYPEHQPEVHEYDTVADEDIDLTKPFIIASDYQHSIAPVPVVQLTKLPGQEEVSLNYVDYFYALFPKGLSDAVRAFCLKYNESCKKVYYVYDHTAIGKRVEADTYITIVKNTFRKYGWHVAEIYTGMAPEHFDKYESTKQWMKHEDLTLPKIRFHKTRCSWLLTSIKRAGTKIERGKTKKEKKYENVTRYPKVDQRTTTHGSDAFDMINDAILSQKLIKPLTQAGRRMGTR